VDGESMAKFVGRDPLPGQARLPDHDLQHAVDAPTVNGVDRGLMLTR
jgi:hypothetical protein